MGIKVGILVFPDVEELDFVGVLETLGMTRRISDQSFFEIRILGVDHRPVRCMNGLVVVPDGDMQNLLDQDVIVIPGGRGVLRLLKQEELMQILRTAYDRAKFVCSVCTGSVLLGKAGLLRGRKATTHHLRFDELMTYSEGVIPVHERVVRDGKIITGAGISSSLDTGLFLIQLLLGNDISAEVARRIEYKAATPA